MTITPQAWRHALDREATVDRFVHQLRLTVCLLPDDPTKTTGYFIELRSMESDEWELQRNVAHGGPIPFDYIERNRLNVEMRTLASMLPSVLPFP